MATQTVRALVTDGLGSFTEVDRVVKLPPPFNIQVRALLTGVCRCDIDMMVGNFPLLPMGMHGHEGLGVVVGKGHGITDVEVGDIVATRGEPAYADYYNVRFREYVKVPEVDPKYILEPVACGINLIEHAYEEIEKRSGKARTCLILGSGFLAWVAYQTLKIKELQFKVDVVGNSNKEIWGDIIADEPTHTFYDVIIDLSSKDLAFKKSMLRTNGLLVLGATKEVTTDFSEFLWNSITMVCPSPRSERFYSCMLEAERYITSGQLVVDSFWTKGYDRKTEWRQAFEDGLNRPEGYSRGYIDWRDKLCQLIQQHESK